MSSTWRITGVVLLAGGIVLIVWAPDQVFNVLRNFLALGNLAIFLFAAVVLAWFFYTVFLRRILRARRIANARMKRMMQDAGARHNDV